MSRSVALLLGAVIAGAATASTAQADGDPASDFLVTANVYLPSQAPSRASAAGLAREVAAAYAAGERIKVAVIAARSDLGAIPSLFGKPSDYAAFLGQELEGVYVGPLLVVMPTGYGIYDGGRSVAAEQSVLDALGDPASSRPDDLVTAAASAVANMLQAHALTSADILKPYVGLFSTGYAPGRLTIRFDVYDDSGHATVSLAATRSGKVLLRRRVRSSVSSYTKIQTQVLPLRRGPSLSGARICLTAVDPTGNRSSASCRTVAG